MSYETDLGAFYTQWKGARDFWAGMSVHINDAQLFHNAGNESDAQQMIINALWHANDSFEKLYEMYQSPYPRYLIIKLFDQIGDRLTDLEAYEPPELTVEAICEAWAKDDFKGRALTIAFIDRMRQLIWNEPFYVAWAARPEQG